MKTIKIIELLNKIANGEDVPQEIKYEEEIYYYDESITDYRCGEIGYYLFDKGFEDDTRTFLKDEIEIIEDDKKIEKIGKGHYIEDEEVLEKIDEIIDYINKEK